MHWKLYQTFSSSSFAATKTGTYSLQDSLSSLNWTWRLTKWRQCTNICMEAINLLFYCPHGHEHTSLPNMGQSQQTIHERCNLHIPGHRSKNVSNNATIGRMQRWRVWIRRPMVWHWEITSPCAFIFPNLYTTSYQRQPNRIKWIMESGRAQCVSTCQKTGIISSNVHISLGINGDTPTLHNSTQAA